MDDLLRKFADSFLDDHSKGQGYSEETDAYFAEWLTQKSAELVYEDHQLYMNSTEMAKHLKKLFNKCEDGSTEKKFLDKLGKAADMEDCSRKDLEACAKKLCKNDEKECDKVIHELENMVGFKKDFSDSKKKDEKDDSSKEDKKEDKKEEDDKDGKDDKKDDD